MIWKSCSNAQYRWAFFLKNLPRSSMMSPFCSSVSISSPTHSWLYYWSQSPVHIGISKRPSSTTASYTSMRQTLHVTLKFPRAHHILMLSLIQNQSLRQYLPTRLQQVSNYDWRFAASSNHWYNITRNYSTCLSKLIGNSIIQCWNWRLLKVDSYFISQIKNTYLKLLG